MTFEWTESCGRFEIRFLAATVGDDLNISIAGGDAPHIGAVALAEPGGEASLIVRPGHREGELAKSFAGDVARATGRICLVSCGIHVDDITRGEIARAVATVEGAARTLISKIEKTEERIKH